MLINHNLQTLISEAEKFIEENPSQTSNSEVTLVGEIGINHNGSLKLAKALIDLANHAGFDYAKLQKRVPSICVPESKKYEIRETPKGEMSYIDYKDEVEFGKKEYEELYKYIEEKDINLFSSLWDVKSCEFMKEFTNIGKIPSPCINNLPLLEKTKELFEFKIISTGMSSQDQIDLAVEKIKPDLVMHSVSSYPTQPESINIDYIRFLKERYPNVKHVGYSGHEEDIISSAASILTGSSWIERHITINNQLWGSDQSLSLEPDQFYELVQNINTVCKAKGGYYERKILDCERKKQKDLRKN